MNIDQLLPTNLKEHQEELDAYTGRLVEIYEPIFLEINGAKIAQPNPTVTIRDTRTLRGETLKALKLLKEWTRDEILKKAPLHKQLNIESLSLDERRFVEQAKEKSLATYETMKLSINNAKSIDEISEILKPIYK